MEKRELKWKNASYNGRARAKMAERKLKRHNGLEDLEGRWGLKMSQNV